MSVSLHKEPDQALSDINLLRMLQLSEEMKRLADSCEADCDDNGCALIYGLLRDSAYRIERYTQDEVERHRAKDSAKRH